MAIHRARVRGALRGGAGAGVVLVAAMTAALAGSLAGTPFAALGSGAASLEGTVDPSPIPAAAALAPALGLLLATLLTCPVGGLREAPRARVGMVALAPLVAVASLPLTPLDLLQLPRPAGAAAVLVGLAAAGAALAPAGPAGAGVLVAAGARRAALLVLVGWAADGAAAGWGLLSPSPPWSPEVAAVLLDLSPRTLLMECGGVDWMRHPDVYEAVGTDRLGPGIRSVHVGSVAGTASVLVGYGLLALRLGVKRRAPRR
ncbi:MAG: hypothetical protein PVJ89_11755 [Planctomycetota bacterium]